jgi:FkbM family methyltransferase
LLKNSNTQKLVVLGTFQASHHLASMAQVRGTMSLRPLDDLFSEDVHLLKLDVEGFEESVLKGAQRLLSSKRVKYLITEANNNLRKREGCLQYVK